VNSKRIFSHIAKSWQHHFSLQIATLLVLVACFTVVSGLITMSHNLYRILTLWGESMQVSVYFDESAAEQNVASVQKFLDDSNLVSKPKFVSKNEALSIFQEQMASYAPDIMKDKDLNKFIPASIQFGVSKSVSPSEQLGVMQSLANSLKGMPGVEDVSYGQEWVKSYSTLTNMLTWGGTVFIGIIAISAVFVMANSIHSSITQRKSEIEVLELIGATQNYIRTPFIWEGALLGGFSSLFALVLSFVGYTAAKTYLQSEISFLQLSAQVQFISPAMIAGLLAFGACAGAISAWVCVRKINDGWAATQSMRI
jgi:cell division transport system permease protein